MNIAWLSTVAALSFVVFGMVSANAAEPKDLKEEDLIARLKKLGMTDRPFTIIVELHVKPESAKMVEELMHKAVAGTHKEAGNIMYDLHKDPEVPNCYYFLERFKSVKAMEDHIGESHTATLLAKFGTDMTQKPRITILDKLSPDRK